MAQFPLAEEAVSALGFIVWSMVEFEADDALATATLGFKDDPAVEVVICSPDKDLAQLVSGSRVVSWDRRRELCSTKPGSLKNLACVGVDPRLARSGRRRGGRLPGNPGLGREIGRRSTGALGHMETIPDDRRDGDWVSVGARLAESLAQHHDDAVLFKQLATLREDVPLRERPADLEWQGAHERLKAVCNQLGDERFPMRVPRWR